jgi:hypothetical protein
MQTASESDSSDHSSGHSAHTPITNALPGLKPFSISPEDACILLDYLEEFENARKRARAKVIERAMGEVRKRYTNVRTFDKRDAKEVRMLRL